MVRSTGKRTGKRWVVVTALAGGVFAATVGSAVGAPTVFSSHNTPSKGIVKNTKIRDVGRHAEKSTNYVCVVIVINTKTQVRAVNTASLKVVTSTAGGKVTCRQTFKPFSATDTKGTTRHCPLKKADAKAGFVCGIALADQATQGQTSASFAKFRAKHSAKK